MKKGTSKFTAAAAIVLAIAACLAFRPAPVEAQCVVTSTNTMMGTPGSPYNQVYIMLNNSYVCSQQMSMNVSLCAPGIPMIRMTLTASANTMATNPSCSWDCTGGCTGIRADNTNGLPVELMDFAIEDEADSTD